MKVNNMKKNKKKLKKSTKILIVALIIIVVLIITGYYLINNFIDKGKGKIKVIDENKEFGYVLEENETELYKDLFKKLKKVLSKNEIDEKEYAELICKLFVADFYNLNNKITKNDVGGTQFIHSDAQENFLLKAKDTFYKGIESDVYSDRTQKLPVVSDITLKDIEESTFEIGEEEVDSYIVNLKWAYKTNLDYETEKQFILVKEDKKLSIVQMNDIEE